jgi:membrane protease subunit HflC
MKHATTITIVVIALLALLGANGIYAVRQGHAAVLTRLGHVEATAIPPGLHFKLPFVQQVKIYDTRVIVQQSEPDDYKTADGDPVRVGFFVRWRIADSNVWFDATAGGDTQVARQMAPLIHDALRAEIASHSLSELLETDGGAIDDGLRHAVGGDVRQKLGIEILGIGVERVLPPDDVLASVYKRMSAEATTRAAALRDKGEAAAAAVRAKGDSADAEVLAAAARQAAAVRGDGDAAAAKIYAQASTQDPRFFRFWSNLETWRKTFNGGGAVVVLDRDSPFMQAIDEGATTGPAPKKP